MPAANESARQFYRVALVLPTEYGYARGVLRGIIAATRERNLYLSGAAARTNDERSLPWLFNVFGGIYGHSSKYLAKWFEEWKPDGIICQIYGDRLAQVYRDTGKPVVELFERRSQRDFPKILPDDVATGQMAARHFLERGFRHFGFFGASWMVWSREREAGFCQEIRNAFDSDDGKPALAIPSLKRLRGSPKGAPDRRSRKAPVAAGAGFTYSSYGAEAGGAKAAFGGSQKKRAVAMGAWLAGLPKPLAVLVANDLWGSELVQAAREAGLRVPDDVAILGVDNDQLLCEITHPPLSSIRLGTEQMGRAAVEVLEQLLAARTQRKGSKLPPEISRVPPIEVIARQSTEVLAVEDPDVAEALRFIRQHAAEGLSVKQLLEELSVNRRTLERRFVSVLGHTPLEEIRRVRLERAKALLRTGVPVYEVASRSGFATPEYLATSFLQAQGITPTQYRRRFGSGGSVGGARLEAD